MHTYISFKTAVPILAIVAMLFTTCASADIADRTDVRNFVDKMAKKHNFDKKKLIKMFRQVDINQKIINAITRPAEAKPWYQYRPIFITQKRIDGGTAFWNKHAAALNRAYKKYGVAPEIIVAIIGVESLYGKHKGRYSVVESLSTLAFNYPKRRTFFGKELEAFLLMAREEKLNPLKVKGSYAGAMGKPQFIASSFRSYAVDFDGDGKRDLWDNSVDVIGSVANYFAKHKWRKDEPVASRATVNGNGYKKLVKKGIKPKTPISTMEKNGISIEDDFDVSAKAALIELELKKGFEHWVGLNNFYVITRYNHSQLYAMAVFQLSQAIKEKRNVSIAKSKASSAQ